RRREAMFMAEDATSRLEVTKRQGAVAAKTALAWKLVETVIDEATAAADRVRLQAELKAADRADAPSRAARDDAAAAVAARLDAEIAAAIHAAAHEDTVAEAADSGRAQAEEQRRRTEAEASCLRADAGAHEGRAADVDAARVGLAAKGVLDEGEDAATGEERW